MTPAPSFFPRLRAAAIGLLVVGIVLLAVLSAPPTAGNPAVARLAVVAGLLGVIAIYLRALPAQNVVAAGIILGLMPTLLELGVGLLFGAPVKFSRLEPISWIVAILLARILSAWLLQSWRNNSNYGLWLLGVTCLLAGAARLLLRSLAGAGFDAEAHYFTALNKCSQLVGYAGIAAISLLLATPWLIKNRPSATPIPTPGKGIP